MVTVSNIVSYLQTIAPPALAESYDNVGLLIGDENKEVHKILVALDVDEAVAKEAKELGADMIVSHHPLLFKPLYRITSDDAVSKTAMALIKHDIALFAMHTNLDSVSFGLCDLFLDKIAKTKHRAPIEGDGENGIGRFAKLECAVSLKDMLRHIEQTFSLHTVRYVGDEDIILSRIAVCNGSGADYIYQAKAMGADCYISGDIKYHHARFSYENHMALIEIPHYAAEKIFIPYAVEKLTRQFGEQISVASSKENIDVWKEWSDTASLK